MWIFVTLLTVLLSYVVAKAINLFYFWKKRGVPHLKPWPFIGNLKDVVLRRQNFTYLVEDWYKTFPNKRYFGLHQFNEPVLLIKDLHLIKQIAIKDFDHFMDRIRVIDNELEPLFVKNLFLLKGQKWREMRVTLSPSFTGNKIRIMFTLMSECAKQFNDYYLAQDDEVIEVEMKDLMSRCTSDIIATCAFGVQCDSIKNKDNTFYKMGRAVVQTSIAMWIKAMVQMLLPTLAKKLKISVISSDITTFFDQVIRETLQVRKEKNIIRPDMIHLLMEAMKEDNVEEESKCSDAGFAAVDDVVLDNQVASKKKDELTAEDIVAQAFLFFLAGFETVSTLLAHCMHELAVNPEIQRKLQAEIDQECEKNGGNLTYEMLANMKYLDMVISETLRKWPPAVVLNRMCTKDFLIEGDQTYAEEPFWLKQGIGLIIPVYGIHRDPKYYPDPEKFDPERFNAENLEKLIPYSYIPFGLGPRNCIGSRLALLETKTLIAFILSKFDVVPTSKTENPLKLSNNTTSPCPDGFWLGLKKR